MTIQLERSGITTPDGVRLNVEVAGPADAPVTVLLSHGWTCSTRSWHNQVEALPQILGPDALRVVTYDHRGHGRSDLAPAGSMRFEQLAEDLVTVLDGVVGDSPVVYAGHSMGGMTLMELGDQRPDLIGDRIRAAVMVSTSSGHIGEGAFGLPRRLDPATARFAPRVMNLVGTRADRRVARHSDGGAHRVAELAANLQRPALRQMVFGKKVDPAEIDLFMADLAVVPGPTYGGFFEAILEHDRDHTLKALSDIPVEIMHGTRDRLLPPRHANRMAAELPTARLWFYPGAGHMLMQERPRDVSHRLASLVRKVSA
ncbi:alpha/beta fold hydrolase [Kribbella kalugense]|uniref:Pimeloyl-ACP methyl ester carboxylesterase n=1 Tax=Kribbella kalugense TaxID=2512221 RepID=A0A4R7ZDE2_9ACTN|nr:alpha/beta hydrolase [Kribbella kalugense]TDW14916.1 pimeloyl-ACP methyl ester carboxylesterase [Kribbella kalugense]